MRSGYDIGEKMSTGFPPLCYASFLYDLLMAQESFKAQHKVREGLGSKIRSRGSTNLASILAYKALAYPRCHTIDLAESKVV
jgi:hypothetical protein